MHAGPELAVAATKSYTAELLALRLLLAGTGRRRIDPRRRGSHAGPTGRHSPRPRGTATPTG